MCIEIGLYIKVVKQLYSMTLKALETSFIHKNQSLPLKVALELFCMVGALTLSVFYAIPVCAFLVKSMSVLQKEKEWIDIEKSQKWIIKK